MKNTLLTLLLLFCISTTLSAQDPPLKIMPMGDSITSGFHGTSEERGCYRLNLEQTFLEWNVNYDFVGEYQVGGSLGMLDPDTQSVGGKKIEYMIANYGDAVALHKPDVILICAGRNNHWDAPVLKTFVNKYSVLVETIQKRSPDSMIIMATLPKFGYDRPNAPSYWTPAWVDNRNNVVLPNMNEAMRLVGAKYGFPVVEWHEIFDIETDLSIDASHPNKFGHKKVADLFLLELQAAGLITKPGFTQPPRGRGN